MKSSETKPRMIWLHVCMDCKMWPWHTVTKWVQYIQYIYIWHAYLFFAWQLASISDVCTSNKSVLRLYSCPNPGKYHLENRWRKSHVLVYHGPLVSHHLGVASHLMSPQCKMLVPTARTKNVATSPTVLQGSGICSAAVMELPAPIHAKPTWGRQFWWCESREPWDILGPKRQRSSSFCIHFVVLLLLVSGGYTVKSWLIF